MESVVLYLLCAVALVFRCSFGQSGGATLVPVANARNADNSFGLASITLNGHFLSYSAVATGLSGPITSASVLQSSTGTSLATLCSPCFGFFLSGVWIIPDGPNLATSLYVNELIAGNLYLTLKTAANGGGEIQGPFLLSSPTAPPYQATIPFTSPSGSAARAVGTFSLSPPSLSYTIVAANLSGPIAAADLRLPSHDARLLHLACSPCAGARITGSWPNASAFSAALYGGLVSATLYTARYPQGDLRAAIAVGAPPAAAAAAAAAATPRPAAATGGAGPARRPGVRAPVALILAIVALARRR
jgi:hypothetical protein